MELARRVFDAVRGDARRYGEFCRADSDRRGAGARRVELSDQTGVSD